MDRRAPLLASTTTRAAAFRGTRPDIWSRAFTGTRRHAMGSDPITSSVVARSLAAG